MFDIGMSELLVIGTVALIVIGPKDLPEVFRQFGRFTAKARAMGREFNRAMEQAARESGVKDVASDLNKIANPRSMGLDAMKAAADKFEKWDPVKAAAARSAPKAAPTAGEAAADSAEAALEDRTLTATAGLAPAAPAVPAAAPSTVPAAAPLAASAPSPAAVAEIVPPATVGAETRALYEKQAAKKKVIADSVAQLKAIDGGAAPAGSAPAKAAAAPRTRKPRAPKAAPAAEAPAADAAAKPAARPVTRRKAATPAGEAASPAPVRKSRKKDAE